METIKTRAAITQSDANDTGEIRYVFTLVHGTWARSWVFRLLARLSGTPMLQWYEEGSPLRQRLEDDFPEAKCFPFQWSGNNSVAARIKATEQLAGEIQKRRTDHPEAEHFIIAHSHGGNIAYYALQQHPVLREQISGIVSLSTPFIFVQPRSIRRVAKLNLLAQLLLVMFSPAIVGLVFFHLSPFGNALLLASSILPLAIIIWLNTKFQHRCLSLTHALKLPTLKPQLVVRAAADEASAALGICQVGIWMIHKTLAAMLFPVLFAEKIITAAPNDAFQHMPLRVVAIISIIATMLGETINNSFPVLTEYAQKLGLIGRVTLLMLEFFLLLWCVIRFFEWLYGKFSKEQKLVYQRVPTEAILVVSIVASVFITIIVAFFYMLLSVTSSGADSASADSLGLLLSEFFTDLSVDFVLSAGLLFAVICLYKRLYSITIRLAASPLYLGYFFILLSYVILLGFKVTSPLWAMFFIMIVPALIAPVLTAMVLGLSLAPAYIYLDLSIEPAPPGSHTIYQLGFRGDLKDRVKCSLNHSIAYEASEIIEAISTWIKRCSHASNGPKLESSEQRHSDRA